MTLLLQPDHSKSWFWQLKLLPFVWLGGLFLGLLMYYKSASIYFSLMLGSVSVSIVGCLFSSFFPFLISVFAVFIHKPSLLLATIFLKGCFFSYVSIAFLNSLGACGWLIRLFFMISDICSLPLLYIFWRRCLRCGALPSISEFLFVLCGQLLIVGLDYHVIFPFFTGLTII